MTEREFIRIGRAVLERAEEAERELTAERAVSDKLEKALKLADIQYMGCGGNLRPEEVVLAMQSVIRTALAEVGRLRSVSQPTTSSPEVNEV